MSNFFKKAAKRAAAGVTALAMCASLTACYSADKTWAARVDGETIPIGSYIYYLTSAYSEGSQEVDPEAEVLRSQVDGQDAGQWIKDRALDYIRSYCYISQKLDQLDLPLDDEDQATIDSASSSMWYSVKDQYEALGVAESSFKLGYAEYNIKLAKLLTAMYGKGGELELSEEEQRAYYTDNYIYYQYFIVDLTTTDEDGATVSMDDDEKAEIKESLEKYVDEISSGSQTIDLAAVNYANASGTEPNLGDPVALNIENMSELFMDALTGCENGEAALIDATTRYYVVQRLDVEEDFEALLADEERSEDLLREIKGEEFVEYTIEQGRQLDIDVNDTGLNSVNLSSIANSMGKNGTAVQEETEDAG